MSLSIATLSQALQYAFPDYALTSAYGELTLEVPTTALLSTASVLKEQDDFAFDQLIDTCVVDYLHYGRNEWATETSTNTGFSRGVTPKSTGRLKFGLDDDDQTLSHPRFAVVTHLLSYHQNHRLRIKTFAPNDAMPVIPSLINIWPAADWYEREAFDLYGVLFEGHPDLRRILTDYGFVGHPFRKDFPLIGNVETRYDPERKRVVYESVSIEPRVLVPRVIRDDNRYAASANEVSLAASTEQDGKD